MRKREGGEERGRERKWKSDGTNLETETERDELREGGREGERNGWSERQRESEGSDLEREGHRETERQRRIEGGGR